MVRAGLGALGPTVCVWRALYISAKAFCRCVGYGCMLTGLTMLPVAKADPSFGAPSALAAVTEPPAAATLTQPRYHAQLMWWTEPAQYWVTVQQRSLAQATYDLFIFKTAEPQTSSDGAELVYQELDIGQVIALYHTGHDRGALAVVSRDAEGYRFRGYHSQPITHDNNQAQHPLSAVVKGIDVSSVTFPEYINNTKLENGGAGWIFSFYGVNGELLSDYTSFDVRTQSFTGSGPLRRPELEKFDFPFHLRFVGKDRRTMY